VKSKTDTLLFRNISPGAEGPASPEEVQALSVLLNDKMVATFAPGSSWFTLVKHMVGCSRTRYIYIYIYIYI